MRYLILAEQGDQLALGTYVNLRQRHSESAVRMVTVEEVIYAPGWCHTIDESGTSTRLELTDGGVVDSDDLGVVFNRIPCARAPQFATSSQTDREYALAENQALWLSWLAALPCAVLNPATPRGLSAPWVGRFEWLARVAKCGIRTRGIHVATDARRLPDTGWIAYGPAMLEAQAVPDMLPVQRHLLGRSPAVLLEPIAEEVDVVIVGDRILGALPDVEAESLLSFAAASGCELLQVTIGRTARDGTWCVTDVSAFIQHSDAAIAIAVADLLEMQVCQ